MFSSISRGRLVSPAFIFLSMIDFTPSRAVAGTAALPDGPVTGACALPSPNRPRMGTRTLRPMSPGGTPMGGSMPSGPTPCGILSGTVGPFAGHDLPERTAPPAKFRRRRASRTHPFCPSVGPSDGTRPEPSRCRSIRLYRLKPSDAVLSPLHRFGEQPHREREERADNADVGEQHETQRSPPPTDESPVRAAVPHQYITCV